MGRATPTTTIQLQEETKAALDKLKLVDRESYDSVIQRILKNLPRPKHERIGDFGTS